MATLTAYRAFDITNVYDINATTDSGDDTTHTYTDANGDSYTVVGTGLGGIVDGGPTWTTVSNITFNVDDSNWWKIAGTFIDDSFDGYDMGYHYNDNIGTLYGMNAEVAWWLRGNDTVNGSSGNDKLRGYDGNDTVNGNDGNDQVTGQRGNDKLYGGNGSDTLKGGSGTNIVDGGAGIDTVSYDWMEVGAKVNLNLTTAQLITTEGEVNSRPTDTLTNIENLEGSNFADTLTGNSVANLIKGLGGADTISAGGGDDTLVGGGGKDSLTGGAGKDGFVFSSPLNATTNIDTIKDFVAADDTIKLENAIFTKLTATGALNSAFFKANAAGAATDSNDYIVYETDTGKLFYDADGSGAGAKVQFALLGTASHPTITAADFVVI